MTTEGDAESFGIQYYSDWSDEGDWYDWDDAARPRWTSRGAAQEWLDGMLRADYERRLARYEADQERIRPARELFRQRMECLDAAGLGKREDESFCPVIGASGQVPKPDLPDPENWRIVPDSDMDEPARPRSATSR